MVQCFKQIRAGRRHRAFTMLEMLVAIGILVLLSAIALPAILKARRIGFVTRAKSDMGAIAMALEAFKAENGDYPRVSSPGTGFAVLGNALVAPNGTQQPPDYNNGMAYAAGQMVWYQSLSFVATKAVPVGTAPVVPPAVSDYWSVFPYNDNCDGPGFRIRTNGKVYGPYLAAEKFKMTGLALNDLWGNPILYFPGRLGTTNITSPLGYIWDSRAPYPPPAVPSTPLYAFEDNFALLGGTYDPQLTQVPQAAMRNMQLMFGDTNANGQIEMGETAAFTGPYILWSAGVDGVYDFPNQDMTDTNTSDPSRKTDDITNFDIPSGLKK